MTSDSHCEECYSNDFEIIDEPNGSEINERNGGVLLSCSSHTMASVDQTVKNAPTVSRNRKMDPNYEIHSKREAAWCREKEKLLQKIKNLESDLKEKKEELSGIGEQKNNSIEDNDQYTALESKYKELKSLLEAEKEKNAESLSKIGEMEAKEIRNSEGTKSQIQEVQNQKEEYKKLEKIHEELEGELIEKDIALKELQSKMKVKEQHVTKFQKQISALENEKRKNEKKIEDCNQDLKKKFEMQKSLCKTIQEEKDTLEEELIAMKLEFKTLMSERDKRELYEKNSTTELQKLTNAMKEVTDERDDLNDKCSGLERENNRLKRLEQQSKVKVSDEAEQLTRALDALNEENTVLRGQNAQLERKNSLVESEKKKLECTVDELKEEIAKLKEKNANYFPRPIRDVDRTTNDLRQASIQVTGSSFSKASTEQWYTTDQGEKALHEIFQKLMQPFPKTELSRDLISKDITIMVKRNHNDVIMARFPKDFPKSPVHVTSGNKETRVNIPYDKSSTVSTFATQVVNILCDTICRQNNEN